MGNTVGCDIGQLLRNDFAEEILKSAIKPIQLDTKGVIIAVTKAALTQISQYEQGSGDSTERLTWELSELQKKKEDVAAQLRNRQSESRCQRVSERLCGSGAERRLSEIRSELHCCPSGQDFGASAEPAAPEMAFCSGFHGRPSWQE